jgi:FG-GAP repeat
MSLRPLTLRMVPILLFTLVVGAMCPAQSFPARTPKDFYEGASGGENTPSVALTTGNWSQFAKFQLPGPYLFPFAGANSVAIAGNAVVVQNASGNVAANIYLQGVLTPVAALSLPPGTSSPGPVAIDGDTVVIGGFASAYVYVQPPGGWTNMTPTATLAATDGSEYFGSSVSISGNTIVVGDPDTYYSTSAGAAYVYVKPAGGWINMTQTAKLTSSDGVVKDEFGASVSISGSTIAVGAEQYFEVGGTGKSYVFVEPVGGWINMTETAELTASDATAGEDIGASVSTNGDLVLTGAPSFFLSSAGKTYLFEKPASGWISMTQTAVLTPADNPIGGWFGISVGVSGKVVVVGTKYRGPPPNGAQGGIYIFEQPASGWQNVASNLVLTGSDAHGADYLGVSVAIDGKVLVGGAPRYYAPAAAYVFGLH